MAKNRLLEAALSYAGRGLAVFPLAPKTKTPITTRGFKDASTDPERIRLWWKRSPAANIGIATGQISGGVFVIDLDEDEDRGISGYDTLRDWEQAHGELPDTARTITGRGGYHLLFRTKRQIKNRTALLPGIDVRGDGGYIVAPPSIHPSGRPYEWEQDLEDYQIADANDRVFELLATGQGSTQEQDRFRVEGDVGEGERNDFIYRMACSMQSRGFSDDAIRAVCRVENLSRCNPPLDEEEVDKAVGSALKYQKGENLLAMPLPKERQFISFIKVKSSKRDEEGKFIWVNKRCADNVAIALREDQMLAGKIRYDTVAYTAKYFGQLPWHPPSDTIGDWTDFDDANLRAYLDTEYQLKGSDIYADGLAIVLNENKFNPIRDFLEALPPWDGTYRIEDLLPGFLGTIKDEYQAEAMRLFMLGAISRAYQPGCKFDYMLVLVGEQGSGKSEFLRRLAMVDSWFDDNFNTVEGDKAVERLRGKWILELAELLAMKKQREVESIKAFVTTRADSYREPYARRTTDRKRCCVFAATTNDYNFLTDRTGNRRFLPVEIRMGFGTMDLFAPEAEAFIRQAWAEALQVWKEKRPKLILTQKNQERAMQMQMAFLEEDPWVGRIKRYLDTATAKERVCAMDLWRYGLERYDDPKRPDVNRLHAIMRNEITGWIPAGKQKCGEWGVQRAYDRELPDELPF